MSVAIVCMTKHEGQRFVTNESMTCNTTLMMSSSENNTNECDSVKVSVISYLLFIFTSLNLYFDL